ncbi:MAG: CerR family C-terminal domain-containing protein [Bauldia sp.]|nr:CerR family C-terminal domain-containing protein [Bauldia sp.]
MAKPGRRGSAGKARDTSNAEPARAGRAASIEASQTKAASGNAPSGEGRNSRHHRRAVVDRGAETRQRLLVAAVDVFGRQGFEGASTREIARAAKANLAAIVYHFGSKEALHVAAAEHLVGRVVALVGPALAAASRPEAVASPQAARAALLTLLQTYAEILLGEREAERWARFIVREQMQPTAAFEVIFRMMGGAHATGARLVATVLGRDPEDETVRLCVFTLMGQILVFRVAHALVLRGMGWASLGERERDAIKRVVVAEANAILDHAVLP